MNANPQSSPPSAIPLRTTPFPNHLLDRVMPHLRDTEWRILCVIVRQTLGWQRPDGKGRKDSDWLTQRQLKQRTGRESEAICAAVDSLVSKGLIEVRSTDGRFLHTPSERRRHAGQMRFRVVTVPTVT